MGDVSEGLCPVIASAQRRLVPRLFAGALALTLLGGQAISVAHFTLVRHATCLDHGLVTHADHAHSARSAAAGWAEGERDPDHGHDHCQILALRRDGAGALSALPAPSAGSPPSAAAPSAAIHRPATDALWRVAPKQSPPSA